MDWHSCGKGKGLTRVSDTGSLVDIPPSLGITHHWFGFNERIFGCHTGASVESVFLKHPLA